MKLRHRGVVAATNIIFTKTLKKKISSLPEQTPTRHPSTFSSLIEQLNEVIYSVINSTTQIEIEVLNE